MLRVDGRDGLTAVLFEEEGRRAKFLFNRLTCVGQFQPSG